MAREFNVGDVVVLKSGGPHMTIIAVGSDSPALSSNHVQCMWMGKSYTKGESSAVAGVEFAQWQWIPMAALVHDTWGVVGASVGAHDTD